MSLRSRFLEELAQPDQVSVIKNGRAVREDVIEARLMVQLGF